MAPLRFRLVSFDIDGTLTLGHGWRFIAERLGKSAEYEAADEEFHHHTVSEDRHLRSLLGIAQGVPLATLERLLDETPKLSGIGETVGDLRSMGSLPILLSHNPIYVCRWYARRFGFLEWAGVDDGGAPEVVRGIIQPPPPLRTGKLSGLARLLARHRILPSDAVHVGDGWADAELFPKVGLGVALNSELPEVDRAADVVLKTRDLRDLLPILRTRTPKRVPETLI